MSALKYFSLFFVYLLILILSNPAESIDTDRYRQEALAQHNTYRAQCQAQPLERNITLDHLAQNWCDQLALKDQFNHSGTIDYGENSYKKSPWDFANDNGATPVIAWFSEKSKCKATNLEDCLHFSQVVWKNTKSFGLGVCNITNNGLIFVGNYYPRGNYKDQFAQNIGCQFS